MPIDKNSSIVQVQPVQIACGISTIINQTYYSIPIGTSFKFLEFHFGPVILKNRRYSGIGYGFPERYFECRIGTYTNLFFYFLASRQKNIFLS